jgi:hypothetical protein
MSSEERTLSVTLGMFDKNITPEVFDCFKKRCLAGQVRAELGSPYPAPGEPSMLYFDRVKGINEERVCAQILDVELSGDGKRMIGVVKPAGPNAAILKKMLEEDGNVTFGMRSFHDSRDRKKERPLHVTTYDLVPPV